MRAGAHARLPAGGALPADSKGHVLLATKFVRFNSSLQQAPILPDGECVLACASGILAEAIPSRSQ